MDQKLSVGRIVHYIEGENEAAHPTNETRVHPAIVTRVWTDHCVNLHVFFDGHGSEPRDSVAMIETPEGVHNPNSGWRWTPRVQS